MDGLARGLVSLRSETSILYLPTEVLVLILNNLSIADLRRICRRVCRTWRKVSNDLLRERLVGRRAGVGFCSYQNRAARSRNTYFDITSVDSAGNVILRPEYVADGPGDWWEAEWPVEHAIYIDGRWEEDWEFRRVRSPFVQQHRLSMPFRGNNEEVTVTSGPFTVTYRWEDAKLADHEQFGPNWPTMNLVVVSVEISMTDMLDWRRVYADPSPLDSSSVDSSSTNSWETMESSD
ncbi:hypothetical protein HKX48_003227 [Thoreauomyces humboldtii]|nr:hypothetical protein HKX48_003227 [Thoreauomyces humboldtii]